MNILENWTTSAPTMWGYISNGSYPHSIPLCGFGLSSLNFWKVKPPGLAYMLSCYNSSSAAAAGSAGYCSRWRLGFNWVECSLEGTIFDNIQSCASFTGVLQWNINRAMCMCVHKTLHVLVTLQLCGNTCTVCTYLLLATSVEIVIYVHVHVHHQSSALFWEVWVYAMLFDDV